MKNEKLQEFTINCCYSYSNFFGWKSEKEYFLLDTRESNSSWGLISWKNSDSHGGTRRATAIVTASSFEEAIALIEVHNKMKKINFTKELKQIEEKIISVYKYRYHGTRHLNHEGLNKYCKLRDKLFNDKKRQLVEEYLKL